MIWMLATRGAATKLINAPHTETPIGAVHSVVYRPGVDLIPFFNSSEIPTGLYQRATRFLSGYVYSYHASAAEELLTIVDPIDLIIYYRAAAGPRKRTISNILFGGQATVSIPAVHDGLPVLIGVPFRAQISLSEDLDDTVVDEEDNG